jgi:hypothetical protein
MLGFFDFWVVSRAHIWKSRLQSRPLKDQHRGILLTMSGISYRQLTKRQAVHGDLHELPRITIP